MKRLYLLAAAVSVTGGMAFSAPQEDAPEKEAAVLDVQTPPSGKQDQPAIPERLLDDSHMNEELGINEFTAPSIRKIFEDLEGLPEIPERWPCAHARSGLPWTAVPWLSSWAA